MSVSVSVSQMVESGCGVPNMIVAAVASVSMPVTTAVALDHSPATDGDFVCSFVAMCVCVAVTVTVCDCRCVWL